MFIIGNEHTSTVTGTAVKEVVCEACGTRYSYRATREGSGKAFAPYFLFESHAAGSAQNKAAVDAEKQLARACDAVPCPACGLVQPAMVRAARRQRHGWMSEFAAVLFVLFGGVNLFVASVIYVHGPRALSHDIKVWAAYASLGGAGVGIWGGRRALAAGYDPNAADRATRIHEGRTRAIDWAVAGDRRAQTRDSDYRW